MSWKRTLNIGESATPAGGVNPPDIHGVFRCKCVAAMDRESQAGNPRLVLTLTVLDGTGGKAYAGRTLQAGKNYPTDANDRSLPFFLAIFESFGKWDAVDKMRRKNGGKVQIGEATFKGGICFIEYTPKGAGDFDETNWISAEMFKSKLETIPVDDDVEDTDDDLEVEGLEVDDEPEPAPEPEPEKKPRRKRKKKTDPEPEPEEDDDDPLAGLDDAEDGEVLV